MSRTSAAPMSTNEFWCRWFKIFDWPITKKAAHFVLQFELKGGDDVEKEQIARDEDVLDISKRLIEQNREAYEDLAK